MISYKNFTEYFGINLFDKEFQAFLKDTFSDLTEYNILEGDCITSEINGVELGFNNSDAIYDDDENIVFEKGNPIFSHFILYPKSVTLIGHLPFGSNFEENRVQIIDRAGNPTQTKEGYVDYLDRNFLVDNYKFGDIVISFDFNPENQKINFIQVRDNNLVEHLKL